MPFANKSSSSSSELDQDLKNKRQKIIEEERIRVLKESLMLFYDKLLDKYALIYPLEEDMQLDEIKHVDRNDVLEFAQEYANTKPLGF